MAKIKEKFLYFEYFVLALCGTLKTTWEKMKRSGLITIAHFWQNTTFVHLRILIASLKFSINLLTLRQYINYILTTSIDFHLKVQLIISLVSLKQMIQSSWVQVWIPDYDSGCWIHHYQGVALFYNNKWQINLILKKSLYPRLAPYQPLF